MSAPRERVSAVVFDWAGTTIDYGCCGPAAVFRQIFEAREVPITLGEAREPMGLAKRDHIAAVLAMPAVRQRWRQRHGRDPQEADIDGLYQEFLPLQRSVLAQHSDLIPGVLEVVAALEGRGIRIGSTTGYTRELMDVVVPLAASQGYRPECVVTSDEVQRGRPAPWMLLEALRRLDVFPIRTAVKVDDTPTGLIAGLNAGCWSVAVVVHGNEMGLTQAEVKELDAHERTARTAEIAAKMRDLGAHYVVESIAQLPEVLDTIDQRLARGERP